MGRERDAIPRLSPRSWALRKLRIVRQTRLALFASLAAAALTAVALCALAFPSSSSRYSMLRGLTRCIAMDESHFDAQYFNPSACISPRERTEAILDLVKTLTKLLDERDLDYWLDSGTLLGQFRQQSVIPWDNDADIGITMQTYTFLRDNAMKPSIASPFYELQVYESDVNPGSDRDWNIPARFVDTKFGLYVDLFVFTESTANGIALLGTTPSSSWAECVKCIQISAFAKWFIVPKDYMFPLIPCRLDDSEALCPAKRTLYLTHLYGADFRIEKPSW